MNRRDMMGGLADMMLPPDAPSWEAEHRYAPQGPEISQGDAYWMSGGQPLPQRSAADAYRMAGLAAMDQYKPNTFRDIDREAIENQYGGTDIHGIKLPPVSRDEPKAWFDTLIGETPADALLNVGLGGAGKLAKGAAALGGLFKMSDPVEAGRAYDPRFWHGISSVKLSKPIGEMLAEKTPTQTVAERFISPEALQGGVMLPAPGDRAQVGEQLLGVGGKRLDIPTDLQGGHGYMPANVDQQHVWASDQGVTSTMAGRLKRLSDQYANVYLPYSAMGERSVDFSHHMSDTLAEMVKDAKIIKQSKDPDKATATTFNQTMREPWGKDFPGTIEKFPGIQSPDLRQWLINAPGKTRSKFAQIMDQAPYQRAGFPDVAEARFAVTDPRLLNEPVGAAGLSISRPNPNVIEPSGHRTYSTALGGDYVGGFERSIPRDVMFPDIVKAYAERKTKHGEPFNPSQQDYAFRMGTPPFFQKTDDQWLEGIMRYLEGMRNVQQ